MDTCIVRSKASPIPYVAYREGHDRDMAYELNKPNSQRSGFVMNEYEMFCYCHPLMLHTLMLHPADLSSSPSLTTGLTLLLLLLRVIANGILVTSHVHHWTKARLRVAGLNGSGTHAHVGLV